MCNPARVLLALSVLLGASLPAGAQQGFALKGHLLYNSSSVRAERQDTLPDASGFGIGAELVLPFGVGVGVSGYTSGGASEADVETTTLTVLAEANYFFLRSLPLLSPYVGVHAGLGSYSREYPDDLSRPELRDRSATELGWQLGARLQLTRTLGVDAQYRRVSTSAFEAQGGRLERSQFLVGVALF